jgi:hypothetical protein
MHAHHLEIASQFLGDNIRAGLILGDMSFLQPDMDWIKDLLETHNIPERILLDYLTRYKQAIEVNLSEAGQPVMEWFERLSL